MNYEYSSKASNLGDKLKLNYTFILLLLSQELYKGEKNNIFNSLADDFYCLLLRFTTSKL